MKEQIGNQLIEVEMARHEKVQTTDVCQINATHLKYVGGNERKQIDDQQVFRDSGNTKHHLYLFWVQKYEKYLFFMLKSALIQENFMKKLIFSDFLLFL